MEQTDNPSVRCSRKTQEKHLKAIFSITIVVAFKPMNYGRLQVIAVSDSSMVALNRNSALLKFSVFVKS